VLKNKYMYYSDTIPIIHKAATIYKTTILIILYE